MAHTDIAAEISAAMRAVGILVDAGDIDLHSLKWQRFKTESGKGKRNGYLKVIMDAHPVAFYGDWSTDTNLEWFADTGGAKLTEEEEKHHREMVKRARAERDAQLKTEHDEVARNAQKRYDNSKPVTHEHGYLQRKGVKAQQDMKVGKWYGWDDEANSTYVLCDSTLIVPLRNVKGVLRSIQGITPEPVKYRDETRDKFYLTGAEKDGLFYQAGNPLEVDGNLVYIICEGVSTALSIHECTSHAVLAAMDRGNMIKVAQAIRAEHGDAVTIVLAADNDIHRADNPGLTAARKAAANVRGVVAYPQFKSLDCKPTDYNDMHEREGADAVVASINAALYPVPVGELADDEAATKALLAKVQNEGADEAAREAEKDAGFTILGFDGVKYFVFAHAKQQVIECTRANFSGTGLLELAPLNWWEGNFAGGKNGGVNDRQAAEFLIGTAHRRGFFDHSRRRKPGAWEDNGRHVFHHGDHLTVDGKRVELHEISSYYVYERVLALPPPSATPMTDAEGVRIFEAAKRFSWEQDSSAVMLCGWAFLAQAAGLLLWRPHIHLIGAAGNGKSSVLNKFLKPLLGGERGVILADGASTEPGLRQLLGNRSMGVIMDEAEGKSEKAKQNNENLYALARSMSSGDGFKIIKGGSNHESCSFASKSMFCFAAINPNLESKADLDRFTRLMLKSTRGIKDAAAEWEITKAILHDIERDESIANRMMGRLVGMTREILATVEAFTSAATAKFGNARDGDQLGTLAAGCWSLTRSGIATQEQARAFLDQFSWDAQTEQAGVDDTQKALDHLMQTIIKVDGRDYAVRELMERSLGGEFEGSPVTKQSARAALSRHGIAVEGTNVGHDMFALASSGKELKALLVGTQASNDPGLAFASLPGAKVAKGDDRPKFGAIGKMSAVLLPLKLIELDSATRSAESKADSSQVRHADAQHMDPEVVDAMAADSAVYGGMPRSGTLQ